MDMQLGEMHITSADIQKIKSHVKFNPKTGIDKGLPIFIDWYRKYYNTN